MSVLRTPLVVLNDLSLPTPAQALTDDEIATEFADLVDVLRASRKARADLALTSSAPVGGLEVTADGRTLGAVLGDRGGLVREQWRYLQTWRNHAPFAVAPDLTLLDDGEEYRHEGVLATALGLAAANGQLAVSWVGPEWDSCKLPLTRYWLAEDQDDVVEHEEDVSVVHATSPAHVTTHESFLRQVALPQPFSGADVWADRDGLFPNLRFLPRVQQQLSALSPGGQPFKQAVQRLLELDATAREWSPSDAPEPSWRSAVSAEAEQRKRLWMFKDLDGESRCFDMHARYTPGHGRIHFRIAVIDRAGVFIVANVGQKKI